MKCFYHADADGKCSAFWVRRGLELRGCVTDPYSFIEVNYRKPFPLRIVQRNEQVWIVDYSISPDEMMNLLAVTNNVIWIDHHKTAIDKYVDFCHYNAGHEISGIRYDGVAACMLTYLYVFLMTKHDYSPYGIQPFILMQDHFVEVMEKAPYFTKLIHDWDVWKFEYGDFTRFFHTAFNAKDTRPTSPLWMQFLNLEDGIHEHVLIDEGKVMTQFRDGWAKNVMKIGYETVFEGHLCFAVNIPFANSEYFKSLPEDTYEILMPYYGDGEKWTVSMYSSTVDVSEIAKKYGGGGHKGAAGFTYGFLPFEKTTFSAPWTKGESVSIPPKPGGVSA